MKASKLSVLSTSFVFFMLACRILLRKSWLVSCQNFEDYRSSSSTRQNFEKYRSSSSSVRSAETNVADKIIEEISKEFLLSTTDVSDYPSYGPGKFCKLTNVFLPSGETTFYLGIPVLDNLLRCFNITRVWNFKTKYERAKKAQNFLCNQIYDRGYAFPVILRDSSDYFDLHLDTLIPLFVVLHFKQYSVFYNPNSSIHGDADMPDYNIPPSDPRHTILLPGFQINDDCPVEWATDVFFNSSSYWVDTLSMIGLPYSSLPLDERLIAMKKTICFKEIFFGKPALDYSNSTIVKSYISFTKDRLGIKENSDLRSQNQIVGILKISNKNSTLVDCLPQNLTLPIQTEIVNFEHRSFAEQVVNIQKLRILIGRKEDGLINGLYLPFSSEIIQVKEDSNDEFETLLLSRGPYRAVSIKRDDTKNISDCKKSLQSLVRDAVEQELKISLASNS